VIGESRIDEQIENVTECAGKVLQKQVDADSAALKPEIEAAEKGAEAQHPYQAGTEA
jgi:hypothetical protein